MIITRMTPCDPGAGGGQYAHLGTNFRTCSMVLPAQSGDLYIRDIRSCTVSMRRVRIFIAIRGRAFTRFRMPRSEAIVSGISHNASPPTCFQ